MYHFIGFNRFDSDALQISLSDENNTLNVNEDVINNIIYICDNET